jgi:hypothetical protein
VTDEAALFPLLRSGFGGGGALGDGSRAEHGIVAKGLTQFGIAAQFEVKAFVGRVAEYQAGKQGVPEGANGMIVPAIPTLGLKEQHERFVLEVAKNGSNYFQVLRRFYRLPSDQTGLCHGNDSGTPCSLLFLLARWKK